MDKTLLLLAIGAVVTAAILLVRYFRRRDSVGYQRRFVNGSTSKPSGEAFPFASTVYLGDGGSSSHSHHHSDCAHTSDGGGGCSDGGGGSN